MQGKTYSRVLRSPGMDPPGQLVVVSVHDALLEGPRAGALGEHLRKGEHVELRYLRRGAVTVYLREESGRWAGRR